MGADGPGATPPVYTTEPKQIPLVDARCRQREGQGTTRARVLRDLLAALASGTASGSGPVVAVGRRRGVCVSSKYIKRTSKTSPGDSSAGADGGSDAVERVINVKNGLLCHRPRLNAKAEIGYITHLAICASNDWNQVDLYRGGELRRCEPGAEKVVNKD